MKKTLFISILLIFCGNLCAQEEPDNNFSRFSLKVQTNFRVNLGQINSMTLSGLIPALQIRNSRGHIHQLEVSRLSVGTTAYQNDEVHNFYLDAGYEFFLPLRLFTNQEKLKPYLGMGLSTRIGTNFFNPASPTRFRQRHTNYNTSLYFLPSLQRQINKRLFIDFALLVQLGEFTITNSDIDDPSIPIQLRKRTNTTVDFFNFQQFAFRFGFGVRL